MSWAKLSSTSDPLFPGAVFRFRKTTPPQEIVDYMLYEAWEANGLGLVRDSGYGAGHVLVVLPGEAAVDGVRAISPQWLFRNWQEWVDSSSTPDEVWVHRGGRLPPEKLPDEEVSG
jgi:hypothetical protein